MLLELGAWNKTLYGKLLLFDITGTMAPYAHICMVKMFFKYKAYIYTKFKHIIMN